MRGGTIACWALAVVMAALAAQLIAQQDEGPILRPKKPAPTQLVMCDLACNWKLDGEAKGSIEAGGSAKANVQFGQHIVVAVAEDGLDQAQQIIKVQEKGQTVVTFELKPVRQAGVKTEQEAQEQAAHEQQERERAAQEELDRLVWADPATA